MSFRDWYESVIHLPPVSQTHDYDCGAAALRSVAEYYGVGPEDEGDFIKLCRSDPDTGTTPKDIVRVARELGLRAERYEHMGLERLKGFLDQGKPVIVAVQAWGDDDDYEELASGHYLVAIGYDHARLLFEDPSVKDGRGHMKHDKFCRQWRDYDRSTGGEFEQLGIVVWNPGVPDEQKVVTKSKKIR